MALLADLREADRVELVAIRGWTAEAEIRHAISTAERCRVCIVGTEVLAIFGDSKYNDDTGLPWMMSSNAIIKYRRQFLAHCRDVVADMRTRHEFLVNMADARNTLAIRWLKWLGFTFLEPVPYGINSEPFHPFFIEGSKCAQ